MRKNRKTYMVALPAAAVIGYLVGKGGASSEINISEDSEFDEEIIGKYLSEYVRKRSKLEKEIEKLQKEKEQLQNSETFNIRDLIVMENVNIENEKELYILESYSVSGIYHEYHNAFDAWYRMHEGVNDHVRSICSKYVHFDEGEPLFNCLTDEEIELVSKNNGQIKTEDLDKIETRIRAEFVEKEAENNNTFVYTKE